MVQTALDLYGQIDILFNNAGFGSVDWFEKFDPERDIETLIHVNLIGSMLVTRAVLPHMLKRGEGHIINMVSVAGLIAAPLITSYAASKFGVRAFTDALRREVSPFGIKVSGIYPGPRRRSSVSILEQQRVSREKIKRIKSRICPPNMLRAACWMLPNARAAVWSFRGGFALSPL